MRRIIPALIIAATSCSAMAAPKAIYVDAQGKPHYNHLHKNDSILDVKHNELWAKDHVQFIDKEIDAITRKRSEVQTWADASKVVMDEKCDSFFGAGCEGATQHYNDYVKHTVRYDDDLALLNKAKADNLAVYNAYVQAQEAAKAAQEQLHLAEEKAAAERQALIKQERASRQAKYAAEQERLRAAEQKRHDVRANEINVKKANMTDEQIKAREKVIQQANKKVCDDSGAQYRDSGMRLGREYKRLVNNITYKYTEEGYDRGDAREMAIETYSSVYEDVQRQYKMAKQQVNYCHKQKLFWNF